MSLIKKRVKAVCVTRLACIGSCVDTYGSFGKIGKASNMRKL